MTILEISTQIAKLEKENNPSTKLLDYYKRQRVQYLQNLKDDYNGVSV